MEEQLKKLKETLNKLKLYYHALGIISFDFETIAPKDARENEAETLNYFSNEAFKIKNSDEMKELIVTLYEHKEDLKDELDKSLIEKLYESYLKQKNITPEFDFKMSKVFNDAYNNWLDAKEKSDYKLFKNSLGEVIKVSKEEVELREDKLSNFYDNLLNDCEKGMLRKDLDPFFDELKEGLLILISKIKNSKHTIRRDFLTRNVPIYKQAEFSEYLLKLNGYDFNRGCIATTEHPFTSDISEFDARVTTHYYENLFVSNIYSIIHEGGHAIFMQNERPEDHAHFINDYITNGMHESVSRFYENIIGRSKEYIHLIYPKFHELFIEEMGDVTEEELYEAVNIVEPSLIRTEADEVTYGLHIIIRYEMEKMICDGKIKLEDINKKWNELYKEYLGIEVPNDSEGVLQDVHWTSGFGYFPSYAIGNCYNAMYLKKLKEDLPFEEKILNGDLECIKEWLKEHVFKHANVLTPKERIKEITGKQLTPKDFLEYLNEKYSKIYRF